MLDVVKVELTYADRRWTQMWQYVLRAHKILHSTASTPGDQGELRADAMTFFILCNHLFNWVVDDPLNRDKVKDLRTEIAKSDAIRICNATANTSKHVGRNKDKLDAHVWTVAFTSGDGERPMSANVEYEEDGKRYERDVVELSDECIGWWTKYIQDHGLSGE